MQQQHRTKIKQASKQTRQMQPPKRTIWALLLLSHLKKDLSHEILRHIQFCIKSYRTEWQSSVKENSKWFSVFWKVIIHYLLYKKNIISGILKYMLLSNYLNADAVTIWAKRKDPPRKHLIFFSPFFSSNYANVCDKSIRDSWRRNTL